MTDNLTELMGDLFRRRAAREARQRAEWERAGVAWSRVALAICALAAWWLATNVAIELLCRRGG